MENKNVVMIPPKGAKPAISLGIQSDTAFTEKMCIRDSCFALH